MIETDLGDNEDVSQPENEHRCLLTRGPIAGSRVFLEFRGIPRRCPAQ